MIGIPLVSVFYTKVTRTLCECDVFVLMCTKPWCYLIRCISKGVELCFESLICNDNYLKQVVNYFLYSNIDISIYFLCEEVIFVNHLLEDKADGNLIKFSDLDWIGTG